MSCTTSSASRKDLLTKSIKDKLSILESEKGELLSLTSEVSNYEVTREEKEWLLKFLLGKGFHLVDRDLALRAIDSSHLARFRKNFITMQDACNSILDGVTRFIGSALSQNRMVCGVLNRHLNEIEFTDVITHIPEDVLLALRGDLELPNKPNAVCLKDLIKFVGDGVVCTLFNYENIGVDLVDLGDYLLIKSFDFKVVKDFIEEGCKNHKSIESNTDSGTSGISSAVILVGAFITLLVIFFVLKS